jgi:hypothetical protein
VITLAIFQIGNSLKTIDEAIIVLIETSGLNNCFARRQFSLI